MSSEKKQPESCLRSVKVLSQHPFANEATPVGSVKLSTFYTEVRENQSCLNHKNLPGTSYHAN